MGIAIEEIRQMTVSERLKLIDDAWESLDTELPLTDSEAQVIQRRLDSYQQDGDPGISWEEFEKRLEAQGL